MMSQLTVELELERNGRYWTSVRKVKTKQGDRGLFFWSRCMNECFAVGNADRLWLQLTSDARSGSYAITRDKGSYSCRLDGQPVTLVYDVLCVLEDRPDLQYVRVLYE